MANHRYQPRLQHSLLATDRPFSARRVFSSLRRRLRPTTFRRGKRRKSRTFLRLVNLPLPYRFRQKIRINFIIKQRPNVVNLPLGKRIVFIPTSTIGIMATSSPITRIVTSTGWTPIFFPSPLPFRTFSTGAFHPRIPFFSTTRRLTLTALALRTPARST